jgi:hypothetical protein
LYSNDVDEHVTQFAAKRYQKYLREEEKRERYSKWVRNIITAILMLIKLLTDTLQKANIKRKRVVEKVSIE